MPEIKYTPEQLAAINDRGGALLVSAAAGSGKTKVLVERLMSRIEAGADADDFLVITYTKAAAAELRGKIIDEIQKRIAQDPTGRHMRRQAALCCRAQISTIHSFCAGIIRENAHLLGLTPDFRVADESETRLLKERMLERVLDGRYEDMESFEGFSELVDTMAAGRDDSRLAEIILDAHSKLQSHPYPEDWVSEQLEAMDTSGVTDALDTVWGRAVMEKAVKTAGYWLQRMQEAYREACGDGKFLAAYGDSMMTTIDGLMEFIAASEKSWDRAVTAAWDIQFPKAGRAVGCDGIKETRKKCKAATEKLRDSFIGDSRTVLKDMADVYPAVKALFRLVLDFDREYAGEKRRRNILDFSDQEHMAVYLLRDKETGLPTALAREISQRFEEIMVDEYQDVNAVQDMIFSCVSRDGKNIFMVGDVKQSIYRFRLADPTIFLKKYASFADSSDAREGEPRRVILSKNFRSRAEILDGVNFIFKNIMSPELGEMEYTEREFLYHGASDIETPERPVELNLLDMSGGGDDEDSPDKLRCEASFTARRIMEMAASGFPVPDGNGGTRPVNFGDFAILLRSAKARGGVFASELEALGIPVSFDRGEDFFKTTEISVMMSILTVIDNPRQDIPLIAAMKSPVFGFTMDELSDIRLSGGGDFYDALLISAEKDEKSAEFLKRLGELRDTAADMPADRLIWKIYEDTGLPAIVSAMPGGEKRRQNLMELFRYARKYESAGYKGLFSFIGCMRGLMERGESPGDSGDGGSGGAVTIMTIHKSKGLEFPVVILADACKKINLTDTNQPLVIHSELGAGPRKIDLERRIQYPTLPRTAVGQRITAETLSEEMRVLYVALTRAREKLIINCTMKDAAKTIDQLSEGMRLPVPPQLLESRKSMGDWILMAALCRPEAEKALNGQYSREPAAYSGFDWDIRLVDGGSVMEDRPGPAGRYADKTVKEPPAEDTAAVAERLAWRYGHMEASLLPSKLTATELKGRFADSEAAEEAEPVIKGKTAAALRTPSFLRKDRGLTPAERGTALHLVMQFIDFEKCGALQEIQDEIRRLVDTELITPEQAACVEPGKILGFFESDTGKLIMGADGLRRELKFSVLVPAERYFKGGGADEILLQGVIDCCAEKNGELIILDFKTDRVSPETVGMRAEYYRGQLEAYAGAMEKMTGKKVAKKLLYFFAVGRTAEL